MSHATTETASAALSSRIASLELLLGRRSPDSPGPRCIIAALRALPLTPHPQLVLTVQRAAALECLPFGARPPLGAAASAEARMRTLETALEALAAVAPVLDGDFAGAVKAAGEEVRGVMREAEDVVAAAEGQVKEETEAVDEMLRSFNAETENVNARFARLTVLVETLERRQVLQV